MMITTSIYLIFIKVMTYFGRYRIINDISDKEPCLERYYLFLKSEPDDLHEYSWPYISIPLYPGYWE